MKRRSWVMATIVLIAVVGFGWWWRAHKAGAAPKYRTAEVDRGTIESVVSATGTIRPVVQVEVGSQVSGTVSQLFADYNSRVSKGQVIVQLEPSSFRARQVQAEAAVTRAEASVKDGERAFARSQDLFKQSVLSQADLDAASVTLELRKADLKQAKAAMQAAQVDLDHTTIRAPIDGVVISRSVDLGQTVAASLQAPTLFTIAQDLTKMQVDTNVDEADVSRVKVGLRASFTVDSFPGQLFTGEIVQIRKAPQVVQNVVTYDVVVSAQNTDQKLLPGMTANVRIVTERKEDALRVPNAALRFRPAGVEVDRSQRSGGGPGGGGPGGGSGGGRGAPGSGRGGGPGLPGRVFIVGVDGKPEAVQIRLGITDGTNTEVVEGPLKDNQEVIVGASTGARPTAAPPGPRLL